MTNRKRFDNLSNAELAKILVKGEWCDGCALTSCGTKGCADYIKTWMDKECRENLRNDFLRVTGREL